ATLRHQRPSFTDDLTMPTPLSFNRRHFLRHAGALIIASNLIPMKTWASPVFPIDPFQLGVASGDPSSDGFVLSGDLHQYFVGVVPSEEGDVSSKPIATEFLT